MPDPQSGLSSDAVQSALAKNFKPALCCMLPRSTFVEHLSPCSLQQDSGCLQVEPEDHKHHALTAAIRMCTYSACS